MAYNNSVLVGNWNEERLKNEVKPDRTIYDLNTIELQCSFQNHNLSDR